MNKYMMIIFDIFCYFFRIFFCSRESVEQFLEFFRKKNLKNGRPGSRISGTGPG